MSEDGYGLKPCRHHKKEKSPNKCMMAIQHFKTLVSSGLKKSRWRKSQQNILDREKIVLTFFPFLLILNIFLQGF